MKKIKVYSTPDCPWCKRLKQYLKEKGVRFEEIDVSTNDKAREEMVEKSGTLAVPQTEINGKIIVGFDVHALENALQNV